MPGYSMNVCLPCEIADEDVRGVLERVSGNPPHWLMILNNEDDELPLVGYYIVTRDNYGTVDAQRKLDLARGLRMMLLGYGSIHLWDDNPKACDAFVQYAAFGELRYV